jgi:tRNA threonylcarbamoyl adenosine modification protein (Sua5/YciO/YrdC/YwlC family)
MSPVFDCTTEESRAEGIAAAVDAVRAGEVVVLPTDTVYGVGADAFSPEAVAAVLAAKGRGREMPPPVLVPSPRTVDGLATAVPDWARDLINELWPGPLTLVFHAPSSLMWDLGDTNGTVALRMPDDRIALELLAETGPLAVSSANLTGRPPATTAPDAVEQLGDVVDVYLDNGSTPGAVPSTIVDATALADGTGPLRIVRLGVISEDDLRTVAAEAFDLPEAQPEAADEPDVVADPAEAPQPSDEAAAP